jgi:hypothetical protein
MSRIFVSYSEADKEFVDRLVKDLQAAGHAVAYDQGLAAGSSFANQLTSAIESADFVLLVLSPDSVESPWATTEWQIALAGMTNSNRHVIPLLVKDCTIPGLLQPFPRINFREDYDSALAALLGVLGGESKLATRIASDAQIGRLVTIGEASSVHIHPAKPVDEGELRTLIEEMRQAVDSFKKQPASQTTEESVTSEERRRCFIVMPFGEEDLGVVYEDFIKPVLQNDCGLTCERGDDVFGSNVIMEDIMSSIQSSDLILADLTRKNPNVFYEVGIAHALGKQVLLLSQSIDDVPFDLRHRRILIYEYSPRGCKRLETSLRDNIEGILAEEVNQTGSEGMTDEAPPIANGGHE